MDGFAFLAADLFAGVTDALALVRLRRIIGADIRGDLADELLVDAFDLILVFSVTVILIPSESGKESDGISPRLGSGSALDCGLETTP